MADTCMNNRYSFAFLFAAFFEMNQSVNIIAQCSVDVSIVVVQRERFSSVLESLHSLFSTIDLNVSVVVVEGASPANVRKELLSLQKVRAFKLISKDYFITPNEARNIGLKSVDSEYVVFADNDIVYHFCE